MFNSTRSGTEIAKVTDMYESSNLKVSWKASFFVFPSSINSKEEIPCEDTGDFKGFL